VDPYEQEVDKVSDQVMRMQELKAERKPEEELLQTKELSGQSPEVMPAISSNPEPERSWLGAARISSCLLRDALRP